MYAGVQAPKGISVREFISMSSVSVSFANRRMKEASSAVETTE